MDGLSWSEACARNREPIREVLTRWLERPAAVLEIGAGTGQHAEYFSRHLPHLTWMPTEHPDHLPMLRARVDRVEHPNLAPARALDVMAASWPVATCDHAYTANTCHIMSWPAVEALFAGIAARLAPGGLFLVYGPFHRQGVPTSVSNADFDHSLRARDPAMGIRDDGAVAELATEFGLTWRGDETLPANNRLLIWERPTATPGAGAPDSGEAPGRDSG